MSPVGLTKTQGWEIGVRRTFPISPEDAWTLLFTAPGLHYWLGKNIRQPFEKGTHIHTQEGTTAEVRSYTAGSLIRLRWQPHFYDAESTLQIRVIPVKTGTTISFHHEGLQSGDQREEMKQHWMEVLDKLGGAIKS